MAIPFDGIWRLENPIQHYAWGSRTAIAELSGRTSPSPKPEAELWMGAHPKAPSIASCGGYEMDLGTLVAHSPDNILGPQVARRFENKLPFLFKVLAAGEPLSIQAHPNLEQAKIGYQKENQAGIPITGLHYVQPGEMVFAVFEKKQ